MNRTRSPFRMSVSLCHGFVVIGKLKYISSMAAARTQVVTYRVSVDTLPEHLCCSGVG